MKTIPVILLIMMGIGSVIPGNRAAPASPATNVIANSSFENGVGSDGVPVDWSFATCEGVANATVAADPSLDTDGGYSAKIQTGPVTPTGCVPGNFNGRSVGFSQFRQSLPTGYNFTSLTDSPSGFSFWFQLQPSGNSSIAGFEVRVFGAEGLAELDYVFNPDPSLGQFQNNTSTHSLLLYGYQYGQWYHFSRDLRADWLAPMGPANQGLPLNYDFALIQFQGFATLSGNIARSETFWLDDVTAYVGSFSTSYLPGVKVGDWWNYADWQQTCEPPCSPNTPQVRALTVTVTTVVSSSVSLSFKSGLSNGTVISFTSGWNLDNGAGFMGGGPPYLIAAGLGVGDHIFNTPSSITINSTTTASYAGQTRQVNALNTTSTFVRSVVLYDKTTGVLLEWDYSQYLGASLSFKLTGTSLWSYHVSIIDNGDCSIVNDPACRYQPNSAVVIVGTTAQWFNTGSLQHTATSCSSDSPHPSCGFFDDPALPSFSSGPIMPGANYEFTFSTPGVYYYGDLNRPWILATIAVVGNATSLPTGPPDFTITANPNILTLPSPLNSTFFHPPIITITSVNEFAGVVNLVARVNPPTLIVTLDTAARISSSTATLLLVPNGQNASALDPIVLQWTPAGSYLVTVTATSGALTHSVNATIVVPGSQVPPPPPDFELVPSVPPGGLAIVAGETSFVNVQVFPASNTVTPSDMATLTVHVSPLVASGPVLSLNPAQVSLDFGISTIRISTSASTPPGNYNITIGGTSGSFTHSARFSLIVLPFPVLRISPQSGTLGAQVTVQGSGFPNEAAFSPEIEVTFDNQFLGFIPLHNGSFSFTFNVPLSQPGLHHVHALESYPFDLDVQADFTVLPQPSPLNVSVSVGDVYFPGQTVTIFVQTSLNGQATTVSSLQLVLLRPNSSNLTLSLTLIAAGSWKTSYTVPGSGSIGTYAVMVRARQAGSLDGLAMVSFQVQPTWLQGHASTIISAVGITGAVGVLVVAWRRGFLTRRKDEFPLR